MRTTPGIAAATRVSIETMRACACGERSTNAWHCQGRVKSSRYLPRPVRRRGSSGRGTAWPSANCPMGHAVMRLGALSLGIEERLLHHARAGALASVLDRDLHLERRPGRRPARLQMRERDVLLEERRPAPAGRVAGLLLGGIDRHAHAPGGAGKARREAELRIQLLHRVPVDLDAHELPLRPAAGFLRERLAADEALLLEVYRP